MTGLFDTQAQIAAADNAPALRLRCASVIGALWAFMDGELGAESGRQITVHLTLCASCALEHRLQLELRGVLRNYKCRSLTPDARRRILARLHEQQAPSEAPVEPRPTLRA